MTSETQARGREDGPLKGDDVEIRIRDGKPWYSGEVFSDWLSVDVKRSMISASGSFSIKAAHRRPWPLRPEVSVAIRVAGESIMEGFVDGLTSKVSGSSTALAFTGRDNTAALVDCSATNEPGEWRGLTVRQILEEIAKPFDVPISAQGDRGSTAADVMPVFKLQPGERAWNAIERITRQKGLMAYAYGDGTLRLARVGETWSDIELVEGERGNVLSSSIAWTHADRFSTIIVRGQSAGSDDGWGSGALEPEGTAVDELVSRHRPLIILASGQITSADARLQAEWESSVRAARSAKLKVTVAGWRKADPNTNKRATGPVWQVNEKIHCTIPSQGLDRQMLIEQVTFKRSGGAGTTTELSLVRPDAFDPKPKVATAAEPFADFLGELPEGN